MSELHCGNCGEHIGYTDGMVPYIECKECGDEDE